MRQSRNGPLQKAGPTTAKSAAPYRINGSGYATPTGLASGVDEMIIGRNLRPSPNVRRRLPVQKTSCEGGMQEKEKRA